MTMGTYSYNGQFGQGTSNPQTGGGMNISTGRLTPNWSGGLGGNAWMKELQNVMKGFGFDYGALTGGAGKKGGLSSDVLNWIGQATGGGGGKALPINASLTDVTAAINAAKPGIYEEQTKGFGNAGARFGRTGMLASSPYMEALGGVARKSSNDIASLIENLTFQANESAAQRRLQGDIATQGTQASLDTSNRNRFMDVAQMVLNSEGASDAAKLQAAQLLGDWYLRMREGDENRTLSYAGMNPGGGNMASRPSYNSGNAGNENQGVLDALRRQLEEKSLREQLNPSGNRHSESISTGGYSSTPGGTSEDPIEKKRRDIEWQQLQYQEGQKPWENKSAQGGDGGTGVPNQEFFNWLAGLGYDENMLSSLRTNPQLMEYFLQKFRQRGV